MVEDVDLWEELLGDFHFLLSDCVDRGMMTVNLPSVITSVINRFREENGGANSEQEMQLLQFNVQGVVWYIQSINRIPGPLGYDPKCLTNMGTLVRSDYNTEILLSDWLMLCDALTKGEITPVRDVYGVFNYIAAMARGKGICYTCLGGALSVTPSFGKQTKVYRELMTTGTIRPDRSLFGSYNDVEYDGDELHRTGPLGFCYNCGEYLDPNDMSSWRLAWGNVCSCAACCFHCDCCGMDFPLVKEGDYMNLAPVVCGNCGFMACNEVMCMSTPTGRVYPDRTAPDTGRFWKNCPKCGADMCPTMYGEAEGDDDERAPYGLDLRVKRYTKLLGCSAKSLGLVNAKGNDLKFIGNLWVRNTLYPEVFPDGYYRGFARPLSTFGRPGIPALGFNGEEFVGSR